jgi:hypothetical protein
VTEGATTPRTEDPASLSLGLASPDAVIDVVLERVLEAQRGYRARGADPLRSNDADTVARKEGLRRDLSALPIGHP